MTHPGTILVPRRAPRWNRNYCRQYSTRVNEDVPAALACHLKADKSQQGAQDPHECESPGSFPGRFSWVARSPQTQRGPSVQIVCDEDLHGWCSVIPDLDVWALTVWGQAWNKSSHIPC